MARGDFDVARLIGDAAWSERCARAAALPRPSRSDVRRWWWRVGGYYVHLDVSSGAFVASPTRCSCPDYVYRWSRSGSSSGRAVCKHVVAVRLAAGLAVEGGPA